MDTSSTASARLSQRGIWGFSWDALLTNIPFFMGATLILGITTLAQSTIPKILEEDFQAPFWGIIVSLAISFFEVVAQMGMIKMSIKASAQSKPAFSDLYDCWPLFFKYLIASIVYGLVTFVGFLLLIVPGVIFATRCCFYPYCIVDEKMGAIDSLRASYQLTQGKFWDLSTALSIVLLVNLGGLLALGIGLLVTIPLSFIVCACLYRNLVLKEESLSGR